MIFHFFIIRADLGKALKEGLGYEGLDYAGLRRKILGSKTSWESQGKGDPFTSVDGTSGRPAEGSTVGLGEPDTPSLRDRVYRQTRGPLSFNELVKATRNKLQPPSR